MSNKSITQGLLIQAMQEAQQSRTGFKIRVNNSSRLKSLFYSTRRTLPEFASMRLLATQDPLVFILFQESHDAEN